MAAKRKKKTSEYLREEGVSRGSLVEDADRRREMPETEREEMEKGEGGGGFVSLFKAGGAGSV